MTALSDEQFEALASHGVAWTTEEQFAQLTDYARHHREVGFAMSAELEWHRAEVKRWRDRFVGLDEHWGKRLKLQTMETLLNGGSKGAEGIAELVCAWDFEKKRADAAEAELAKAREEAERLAGLLRRFLSCPEIAHCYEDCKDPDTDALEREARAALAEKG